MLLVLFWAQLAWTALIYVCGEFLHVDLAFLSGASPSVRYIVSTVMILLSLALIPLALKMFRIGRIRADLVGRGAPALRKWGCVRLLILGDLLFLNTILYYLFGFEPAFGYLAVVALLTLPFVYPAMNRCLAETEED